MKPAVAPAHPPAGAPGGLRIESIVVDILSFPLERPFRAAVREIPGVEFVLTRVIADSGLSGLGYAFAFGRDDARTLAQLVRSLARTVHGCDPVSTTHVWQRMWDSLVFLGQSGAGISAMAAIDIALWDLRGKVFGAPLHRLLGGAGATVPAYGSGGSLSLSRDELVREMCAHAEAGFGAVKMKAGLGLEEDGRRIAAVRAGLGSGVRLIVDGNQQWNEKEALAAAAAFAPHGLWWLEEPLPAARMEECAAVRARSDVAIATGETNFTPSEFDRLIRTRAADILMPNLQRVGGITPWLKVAAAAELAGIPVASHVFPEVNVHLMSACPNGLVLEYIPWWPHPFAGNFDLRDGRALPPEAPGIGWTVDETALARHRIE